MEKENKILDSVNSSENPFKVPKDYFSTFITNIEGQIIKESKKERSLYNNIKPWLFIAASFLIIGFGIRFYPRNITNIDHRVVENTEFFINEEDSAILYSYLDDLMLIEYLISDDEYEN
jgi:hypothetical protein